MVSKKEKFKLGDLVAVSGGSIGKDGAFSDTAEVCVVVAVGESDLIVEQINQQTMYKVPQALCDIIKKDPSLLKTSKVMEPEIGDLVLSYERKIFSQEEPVTKTGVLYKVGYKLGYPDKCTILCGSDFEEVLYKNIIVVQKK